MKKVIENIKNRVLQGEKITKEESIELINLEDNDTIFYLASCANEIRKKLLGDSFELCTIINAKSGSCSEDCKYCAQSALYNTGVETYNLLKSDIIIEKAKEVKSKGVHRFSLVTSGRGMDKVSELNSYIEVYEKLTNTPIDICASHGIITYEVAMKLKELGVTTYHHNLESSENFYNKICSTHSFQDRVNTVENVKKAGLRICSGGIIGLGETREDRVDLAFTLSQLEVDSIPLNIYTPIKGTPLYNSYTPMKPLEILKTIALFRFINPKTQIRLAGGRILLQELEEVAFNSGINAILTGDFLTTTGSTIEKDREIIKRGGFCGE